MSIFINENILNEVSTSEKRYYRLTFKNMDGETVQPSVPKNYFTKNGYEDGVTKRVCFAPDIGKCLMAMSMKLTDMEFFVMIPDGKYEIYKPSVKEVPDSKITGEVWIKEPVKLKCIGKIKCTGDAGKDGHEFTYGDGKKAELYDWNWEWIERKDKPIHENLINQWWDRTGEARLRDRHAREEKEAKKKEEQEAAKHDESHLKEHGLITQKEFDQCFAIAKKEFLSHRKLSYNSSFKPNNYKYYKYDKNDFIRFIVTEYKDYFKSEDEEVWEAGMKEFRKMIKKVVDKINLGIKDAGLEGITFYSEDLHEAMYFYLESDRVKEDKR